MRRAIQCRAERLAECLWWLTQGPAGWPRWVLHLAGYHGVSCRGRMSCWKRGGRWL